MNSEDLKLKFIIILLKMSRSNRTRSSKLKKIIKK